MSETKFMKANGMESGPEGPATLDPGLQTPPVARASLVDRETMNRLVDEFLSRLENGRRELGSVR